MREHFVGKYYLPKQSPNTFMHKYESDIDNSEPLEPEWDSYFKYFIGLMRWIIEIGCIDIATGV